MVVVEVLSYFLLVAQESGPAYEGSLPIYRNSACGSHGYDGTLEDVRWMPK